MLSLACARVSISFLLFVTAYVVPTDVVSSSLSSSPWLRNVTSNPRLTGCWGRPWICGQGGDGRRSRSRMCCRNQCVDVSSDSNNCGLCGLRCAFGRRCCSGLCVDTNTNWFHCGRCEHSCGLRGWCIYGLCGYADEPKLLRPPNLSPPWWLEPEPKPPHGPEGYEPPGEPERPRQPQQPPMV